MSPRLVRFLLRNRRLFRPLLSWGPVHRRLGRAIWQHMEAQPGFNEGLRDAEADIAAGRWYRWNHATDEMVANPDWPADGPQPDHPRGEWARRRPQ